MTTGDREPRARQSHISLPSIVERLRSEARVARAIQRPAARFLKERIQATPDAILITDADQRYIAVNRAASELTGYTETELLSRSLQDLTPAPHRRLAQRLWLEFLRSGVQTSNFMLCRKDGSRVQVHYSAAAHLFPGVHIVVLRPMRRTRGARG